jgi:hypothetical protein
MRRASLCLSAGREEGGIGRMGNAFGIHPTSCSVITLSEVDAAGGLRNALSSTVRWRCWTGGWQEGAALRVITDGQDRAFASIKLIERVFSAADP